jgi:hypothetical protein
MIAALTFLVSLSVGQGQPSPGLTLERSVSILACSVVVEYWPPRDKIEDPREVWLRSTTELRRRVLLTTFGRDADVLFSPDCRAVALNDYAGSDTAFVRLFRRNAKGGYEPLPNADATAAGWALFSRTYGIRKVGKWIDHVYGKAIAWSQDSGALLIWLQGHTDIRNRVDDWYCVYDLAADRASFDLRTLNRASVHVGGKLRR